MPEMMLDVMLEAMLDKNQAGVKRELRHRP